MSTATGDVVYTPEWVARDMIRHFPLAGTILDPCRGKGAFHNLLPEGSPWCEITDGRDFFDWKEPVDWIIGNPPFSQSSRWFRHSFDIADNVLYLLPLRHMFSAYGRLADMRKWGGVVEIRLYGGGSRVGFPMGNAVGAVHMFRGYRGGTTWTDQRDEAATGFVGPCPVTGCPLAVIEIPGLHGPLCPAHGCPGGDA